jgi:hypothetical protein
MPISVPPYMPMRQEVRPGIDIAGAIGGLGDALQQGLEYGHKRKIERATQQAFADGIPTGPDGTPDYTAMAAKLFQVGDVQSGLGLTRLAETELQNAYLRGKPILASPGTVGFDPVTGERVFDNPKQPDIPAGYTPDESGGLSIVPGGPADPDTIQKQSRARAQPKARSLPSSAVNSLSAAGQGAIDINRLTDAWSDDYAGQPVTGGFRNWEGRTLPGSKYADQANWWQDYQARKNEVRHSRFGGALTPQEAQQFLLQDITPNMDPKIIKRNLQRQQDIITNATKRLARTWILQGYDADAVANQVGYSLEELGIQPPAEDGAPVPGSTENAAGADAPPVYTPPAPDQPGQPAPDQSAPPPPQQSAPQQSAPQEGETRSVGGKTYIFQNGQWWEE